MENLKDVSAMNDKEVKESLSVLGHTACSSWPILACRAMLTIELEKQALILASQNTSGGRMTTLEKSVRDGLKGKSVQARIIAEVLPQLLEGKEDGFSLPDKHGSAKLTLSILIKVVAVIVDSELDLAPLKTRIAEIKAGIKASDSEETDSEETPTPTPTPTIKRRTK